MADFFAQFRSGHPADALDAWLGLRYNEKAAWAAARPGPDLSAVMSRISSMPRELLEPDVNLHALAGDVLDGGEPLYPLFELMGAREGSSAGVAVVLWVWASESLVAPFDPPIASGDIVRAASALALRLAPFVPSEQWFLDAARREEAARLLLLWAGFLPAGEDAQLARTRWERLDTVMQAGIINEALVDFEHRVEVARVMREKAAAEAAARYRSE